MSNSISFKDFLIKKLDTDVECEKALRTAVEASLEDMDADHIVACVKNILDYRNSKLTEAGITTKQLEALANGEAWITEWVPHDKASPTKEEPYLLYDYIFETPILCMYHKADGKAYSANQYEIGCDVMQAFTGDSGATTHLLTFNGNNGELPKPKGE